MFTKTKLLQKSHCIAYVCLGSNATEARSILFLARRRLNCLPDVFLDAISPIYSTAPQDYKQQPWFLNQVIKLLPGVKWKPNDFLKELLKVEMELGRVREVAEKRFGPRLIDIDLLLYDTEKSSFAECVLPHPRMTRRAFVLVPLLDIAPDICIDNIPAAKFLASLKYRVEGRNIFQ